MRCLKDGLILESQLSYFSVLVFQHTVILLLLTDTCKGQSQGVGSSQPIITLLGDDVILPCNPEPAVDSVSMSLEWGRPDLEPRFVHVRFEGQDLLSDQNPSYKGRTSMSIEKLKHGDLSLTLSNVKVSDNGIYRCYLPSQGREYTVQLVVGSVSSPIIAEININSSVVVLQCECKGWYPEPEVFWLDGEGNLLSAGPTETVRGPDELYTVSSRVTVEKRHSNSFTCRVQQNNINQTREAHVDILADCPVIPSYLAARLIIVFAAFFICTLAFVFVLWKWHQTKTKKQQQDETEKQLLSENRKKEKKDKLDEELQKNKAELTDLEQVLNTVTEQKKELKNERDQLLLQQQAMERKCDEIEKKLQSVEKEAESDRVKGYWDLKEIIMEAKRSLRQRKEESEKLEQNISYNVINKTDKVFDIMTDRKRAVENHMEKIREQQQEIEKQNRQGTHSSTSHGSLDDN